MWPPELASLPRPHARKLVCLSRGISSSAPCAWSPPHDKNAEPTEGAIMGGFEILKEFYLLRQEAGDDLSIPTPLRAAVEALAERRSFVPGEFIFREGDPA